MSGKRKCLNLRDKKQHKGEKVHKEQHAQFVIFSNSYQNNPINKDEVAGIRIVTDMRKMRKAYSAVLGKSEGKETSLNTNTQMSKAFP